MGGGRLMGNRGRAKEGRENRGHLSRVVLHLVNTRARIKDGGGLGQDAGATISIGHARPNADIPAEGLVAGIMTVRGPVTGFQGRKDSGGAGRVSGRQKGQKCL